MIKKAASGFVNFVIIMGITYIGCASKAVRANLDQEFVYFLLPTSPWPPPFRLTYSSISLPQVWTRHAKSRVLKDVIYVSIRKMEKSMIAVILGYLMCKLHALVPSGMWGPPWYERLPPKNLAHKGLLELELVKIQRTTEEHWRSGKGNLQVYLKDVGLSSPVCGILKYRSKSVCNEWWLQARL